MRNIIRCPLIRLIDWYQATLSPDHGPLRHLHPYGFCRHSPTCSEFARQAIFERGLLSGSFLSLLRICSCTPWKAPSEERIMEVCYGKE